MRNLRLGLSCVILFERIKEVAPSSSQVQDAGLSSRRSRVQIPPGPPIPFATSTFFSQILNVVAVDASGDGIAVFRSLLNH